MTDPTDDAVHRVATFYETLTPGSLSTIGTYYAAHARFKDPFNDVQGVEAIRQIFEHMFHAVDDPRFVVTARVTQGQQAFLTWDFTFRFKRFDTQRIQTIRGASHLVWDAEGRVTLHRDYWDAAEELYEKLPGVGALMRWLKRRARE